jgi:hypothetical protein
VRTLTIPFPDISYYQKSRLYSSYPQNAKDQVVSHGSTEIFIRNPTGISVGDLLVIDAFESEDAEIVWVTDVDLDSHTLTIDTATHEGTTQDHAVGVVMTKTPFDQVEVFSGDSSDITTHKSLGTIPLQPDEPYTYFYDPKGIPLTSSYGYGSSWAGWSGGFLPVPPLVNTSTGTFYSYRYVNSYLYSKGSGGTFPVGTYGDQVSYVDSDYRSVITVDQIKNWFMFGLDLTDDEGYPFPNSMFEFAIRAAVDSLQKTLMVCIKPTTIIGERQDYYRQDYMDFSFIQLNNYPIFDVMRVALRYPTAGSDITFPPEWYQVNKQHGQVHLIPTSGSLSQILIGQGGDYLSFVWKGWDWMPNLWIIDYMAGFAPSGYQYVSYQAAGQQDILSQGLPNDLMAVVGKMACFYPLNIAGDLVGGIAIASKSIGIDGLSQSINTTSSPENAGYSARLRQYERELKIEIPRLVAYYKGLRMAVA